MKKLLNVALLGTVVLSIACGFVSCGKPNPNNEIVITLGNSVNIGGVHWATRNVGAPGQFVDNYWDAGMFYRWNEQTAYPSTGSVDGYPTNLPAEGDWTAANNPCPNGYRLPTKAEQDVLNQAGTKSRYKLLWDNDKHGMIIYDNQSRQAMFLPAAGYRDATGVVSFAGSAGYYWRNEWAAGGNARLLRIENILPNANSISSILYYLSRKCALPIRCVKTS
jgi:uncharacterized protein (TIGR02145 family)